MEKELAENQAQEDVILQISRNGLDVKTGIGVIWGRDFVGRFDFKLPHSSANPSSELITRKRLHSCYG